MLFTNISELYTFSGVEKKNGRKIIEEDLSCIKKAALVTFKGRIHWLGPQTKIPKLRYSRKVDLQGRVVLPAFHECHTHSVFAGNRSAEFEMRNTGVSYEEIARLGGGIVNTVSHTRKASEKALLVSGQKVADAFIAQGVTSLEVKSGYGLDLKNEEKMLRVAAQLKGPRIFPTYLGLHAVPVEFKSNPKAFVEQVVKKDLPAIAKKKLAKRVDIFIEKNYFDLEDARTYLEAARDLGLDIVVHAEQLHATGATSLAIDYQALSVDHVVEVTDKDIAKLAKSHTSAVLLPTSDVYIHIPFPKARKMIEAGVRVALATDYNPGTSPTWDLACVGVLARLEMKMTLPEVLSAYTYGAACALGIQKDLGSLAIGKYADFSVLDGDLSEVFYQMGHMPIAQVYREGKLLSVKKR